MLHLEECGNQTGYVLMQDKSDGVKKPLGYWSWMLDAAEQNYDKTHCKFTALAWAMLILGPSLETQKFTIRTDCDVPEWFLNLPYLAWRLARWRPQLSELDFKVVHRKRIKIQDAYVVSWLATDGTNKTLLEHDTTELAVSLVQHIDCTSTNRTEVRPTNTVYMKAVTSPSEDRRTL